MSRALVRYVAADALGAQRWFAPVLCYVAAVMIFSAGGGPALGCYEFSAMALFPGAIWLSVAVGNSEDPIQTAVTVVTVGGALPVRLAKIAVAYLGCLALSAVAVLVPLVEAHPATVAVALAGAGAHLLTALAGVALGSLLCRPVLDRMAWVVLAAAAAFLAEVLIPGVPPVRQVLELFGGDDTVAAELAGPLAVVAVETAVLASALVAAAHRIACART